MSAAIDTINLLAALGAHLATAAGVTGPADSDADGKRCVWVDAADEAHATPAFTTLIGYGGVSPFVPLPELSVQCAVVGDDGASAWSLADRLHGGLLDDDGRPVRNLTVTHDGPTPESYRIAGVANLRRPALVGRDDKGRPRVVFNFDLLVHRLA